MLNYKSLSQACLTRRVGFLVATSLLFLYIAASVYAHAIVLWCYVENNRVYVEAFFMGGGKAQDCKIFVLDKDGKKLLEGVTNKEGLWDFVPPMQDDMIIVVKVDSGHGADFKLTKQDFLDAAAESAAAGK